MESIGDSGSIAEWKHKAATAAQATPHDRTLLLDSLALELTSHLRARREQRTAHAAVRSALGELEAFTSAEAESWCARLCAALDPAFDAASAQALAGKARTWSETEHALEDTREQREAVLRGLAAVGDEVREGMAAAWTAQDRISTQRSPRAPSACLTQRSRIFAVAKPNRHLAKAGHVRNQEGVANTILFGKQEIVLLRCGTQLLFGEGSGDATSLTE